MRCFVAITLPEPVRARLGGLISSLAESGARVSWSKVENLHMTLRFLGELDEDTLDTIMNALREPYAHSRQVTFRVRGLSAFPRPGRPEIVWVGAEEEAGNLNLLQLHAEEAARSAGLPPDIKRFHPHITLGRVRERSASRILAKELEVHSGFDAGDLTAECVTLFKSNLGHGGARYEVIEEFPLCL